MLIGMCNERIAGSHVLKCQASTPKGGDLSQSQSLSPIWEDINKGAGVVVHSLYFSNFVSDIFLLFCNLARSSVDISDTERCS
jgi:hypothetical protein